jgi:hypothetical protein
MNKIDESDFCLARECVVITQICFVPSILVRKTFVKSASFAHVITAEKLVLATCKS